MAILFSVDIVSLLFLKGNENLFLLLFFDIMRGLSRSIVSSKREAD
jgi:hypothetical protein